MFKSEEDASSSKSQQKRKSLNKTQNEELERIYNLKCNMLLEEKLSYISYLELREEIWRLNAMRESLLKHS